MLLVDIINSSEIQRAASPVVPAAASVYSFLRVVRFLTPPSEIKTTYEPVNADFSALQRRAAVCLSHHVHDHSLQVTPLQRVSVILQESNEATGHV